MDRRRCVLGKFINIICAVVSDADCGQKNVYSVYRFDPPSVGFADLSMNALNLADVNGALPSATIGTEAVHTAGASSLYDSRSWAFSITLSLSYMLTVLL